tara:strand:- start:5167 stop:5673 length:507 start_codon:yes stop_codon:yes gene_type:complete
MTDTNTTHKPMTNFQKVMDFNKKFGVPVFDTRQTQVTKDNPSLTKLRYDLIAEEVSELKEAIDTHNFTEIIDALSDILYVVYGAGCSFGIDLDKTFDIVHRSNMSKLCTSEEIAQQTVGWYKQQRDLGNSPYDSPAYRKADDGEYWVVYNESTGKILKSIKYTPAKFT